MPTAQAYTTNPDSLKKLETTLFGAELEKIENPSFRLAWQHLIPGVRFSYLTDGCNFTDVVIYVQFTGINGRTKPLHDLMRQTGHSRSKINRIVRRVRRKIDENAKAIIDGSTQVGPD